MTNLQPITASRFFRRLGFFLLTLTMVDAALRTAYPALGAAFEGAYRLPLDAEMALLPAYVRHIEQSPAKDVVFVGSSPTYGVNIGNPALTYPYAFEAAARSARLPPFRVHNVSAKGWLMADQHFVIKRLVDDLDVAVLQLNYHTFSPAFLAETKMRHPEMPDKLEVAVDAEEGSLAGIRPTPVWPLNPSIRQVLRQAWFVYRERDALAVKWWGAPPENALFQRIQGRADGEQESEPFLDLPPARQLMIMQRYGKNAAFDVKADNTELRFLKKTLALLKAHNKPAVVFMTPLNVEALDYYEALDWAQYDRNVARIRQVVEEGGGLWLDRNRQNPLPAEHFFDISHTLDSGGDETGRWLFEAARSHLAGVW